MPSPHSVTVPSSVSKPVDPAILAAVRQVLAEAGIVPAPPAPSPSAMRQVANAPQLKCHRCGFEASRAEVRGWEWTRTADGWVCHLHSPCDLPLAVDLVRLLGEQLDELTDLICVDEEKDPVAILDSLDHASHLLQQVVATVEPLRVAGGAR